MILHGLISTKTVLIFMLQNVTETNVSTESNIFNDTTLF